MQTIRLFAATIGIAIAASQAQATPVTFDFDSNSSNTNLLTQTVGGVTVNVTAAGGLIRPRTNGLGVAGDPEGNRIGLGETLTFDFGSVSLASASVVVFENQSQDEDFSVTINGTTSAIQTISGLAGTQSFNLFDLFSASVLSAGVTSFAINGEEPDAAGRRGIKVQSVTVSPVPLPASALLLGGAMLGLVGLRRRQQAA